MTNNTYRETAEKVILHIQEEVKKTKKPFEPIKELSDSFLYSNLFGVITCIPAIIFLSQYVVYLLLFWIFFLLYQTYKLHTEKNKILKICNDCLKTMDDFVIEYISLKALLDGTLNILDNTEKK